MNFGGILGFLCFQNIRNMETFFSQKSYKYYTCDKCDYITSYKKDFNKHLLTRKHKMETDGNHFSQKMKFQCDFCERIFQNRSGLWKHNKKCTTRVLHDTEIERETVKEEINKIDIGTISELMKQNTELRSLLIEQRDQIDGQKEMLDEIKNKQENIVIHNTQNNYNIQMFLREKCKDAINLSEFIQRIEVSRDDLENNAQLGFVNGMTKILMDNLRQLTLYQRPIHCTDVKRETMYIKDHDEWLKEENNKKLQNAIQDVSRKSISSLIQWKKTNPDYEDLDSEFSNKCIVIQKQSTSFDNYPQITKVIHNIARENSIKQNKMGL
tara:strand:- start:63 stop:1037 length:975 start_codon:yes stop_codon:yes gene_type:complete